MALSKGKTNGPDWSRFQKANNPVKNRIIGASFGEVGTLKTSWWLGAPGPIVIQSLDRGLEGVIEPFQAQKDIYVAEYDANTSDVTQEQAESIRDQIIEDFKDALTKARTIIWDKETQIYEIFKWAEFGAPSGNPKDYYPLFQRYRSLFNMAKDSDVNFGVIQGMRTPWVPVQKGSGKTGAAPAKNSRERRGMPEIDELVHINIEHVLEDGEFRMKIGKSRGPGGQNLQNTEIAFLPFADFAGLMFPDSDPSEWV